MMKYQVSIVNGGQVKRFWMNAENIDKAFEVLKPTLIEGSHIMSIIGEEIKSEDSED